jgi:hypothetical protein
MNRPAILAVSDDTHTLSSIEQELIEKPIKSHTIAPAGFGNPAVSSLDLAIQAEQNVRSLTDFSISKRYAADYEIVCERSASAALGRLEEMKQAGQQAAILLAECWMTEMDGTEFLMWGSGGGLHRHPSDPSISRRVMITSMLGAFMRAHHIGSIRWKYHVRL